MKIMNYFKFILYVIKELLLFPVKVIRLNRDITQQYKITKMYWNWVFDNSINKPVIKKFKHMTKKEQKLAYKVFLKSGCKESFEGFLIGFSEATFYTKTGNIEEF